MTIKRCAVCRQKFAARRKDKRHCKPACRVQGHRIRRGIGVRRPRTRREHAAKVGRLFGVAATALAVAALTQKLAQAEKTAADLRAENEHLRGEFDAERARLRAEAAEALEQERAQHQKEMADLRAEYERQHAEAVAEQERLRAEKTEALDKAAISEAELRQALVNLHIRLDEAEAGWQRSEAAHQALAAQHATQILVFDKTGMRVELTEVGRQKQKMFEDLAEARNALSESREQNQRLKERSQKEYESLALKWRADQATIASLVQERQQVLDLKAAVEARLQSPEWKQREQLQTARGRISALERSNAELTTKLADAQASLAASADASAREAELNAQIDNLKKQLESSQEKESKLTRKNKRLKEKNADLRALDTAAEESPAPSRLLENVATAIGIEGAKVAAEQVAKQLQGADGHRASRPQLPRGKARSASKTSHALSE